MASTKKATGLIAKTGIELLTYGTPMGLKTSILLEELKEAYGKDYTYQLIDINQNVQKEPWFTKLNPNGRIPVIVDHDKGGFPVMETTAILNYLVRFYDPERKFSFEDPLESSVVDQWMAWQQGGMGPAQVQAFQFYRFQETRHPFPTQRFVGELLRHYGILDKHLSTRDYIAGPKSGRYSIADISMWTLINSCFVAGIKLERFHDLYKWWERIGERPAVQKGMRIPSGQDFPFGYKKIQQQEKEDPVGFEEREGPLREALEKAQKEFGWVYKSP